MKSRTTSSSLKNTKFSIIIIFSSLLLSSCEKEFIEQTELSQASPTQASNSIRNGRLYFPNKEAFTVEYDKFRNLGDTEMLKLASKMHGEIFIPLRPIITEENEEIVFQQLRIRSESLKKKFERRGLKVGEDYALDHLDDLEDVIGDEAFANFLNTKAEVQIGSEIYKYTDVGLFITEESNYDGLTNYLEVKEISDDLMVPTSQDSKLMMISEVPEGGYTSLENEITYYRAPVDQLDPYPYPTDPYPTPIDDGGSGGGTTLPAPTPDQTLESFLSNLNNCSASKGLFGDVFGTNRVCIDKYESERRVKTKAYNYDYGLAYNVGVKVKHQKKGWTGIWRKEVVDEIALGVEYARFEYSFMPIFTQALQNLDFNEKFISPLSSSPSSGVYHFSTNTYGNIVNVDFSYTPYNPYPYELFQSDLIIETWSNNDLWDKYVTENINESTRSENLNEFFWSTIWSSTKSTISDLVDPRSGEYEMPDDIIYASKHPTIGKVQIFQTLKRRRYNDNKIEKSFDWGVGIQLTLSSKNSFQLLKGNVEESDLQKPKNYHASLFGAVKRNGVWHGSKLSF